MIVCFDSNVLIYAFDEREAASKRSFARALVHRVLARTPSIPAQIIGEFLAVAHRKPIAPVPYVRNVVDGIQQAVELVVAQPHDLISASALAERYQLQYFDAVICTVARRAGASVLFSEDMQDGLRLGTLTIVDPFKPDNAAVIEEILG